MPYDKLPPRYCSCGCGKMFTPSRNDQRYFNNTCKTRAFRNRHKPTWYDLLAEADKNCWQALRENPDKMIVRMALAVEMEGKLNGAKAASNLLYRLEYIWDGCQNVNTRQRLEQVYPGHIIDQVTVPTLF